MKHKIVLITGGARGLGLEIAKQFLAAGAQVVLCSRKLTEAEAAARTLGAGATAMQVDISDSASVEELVRNVEAKFGRLDVLVNNASIFVGGPIASATLEDYRGMLEVNTLGTISLTTACLPLLKASLGGVISISSAAAILPLPHLAPYAASKAATQMFMQNLEVEQGKKLAMLTVYPGFMPTGFFTNATFRGDESHERAATERLLKMPLLSVAPEVAARAIVRAWIKRRRRLILPWLVRLGFTFRWMFPGLSIRIGQKLLQRYYLRR